MTHGKIFKESNTRIPKLLVIVVVFWLSTVFARIRHAVFPKCDCHSHTVAWLGFSRGGNVSDRGTRYTPGRSCDRLDRSTTAQANEPLPVGVRSIERTDANAPAH